MQPKVSTATTVRRQLLVPIHISCDLLIVRSYISCFQAICGSNKHAFLTTRCWGGLVGYWEAGLRNYIILYYIILYYIILYYIILYYIIYYILYYLKQYIILYYIILYYIILYYIILYYIILYYIILYYILYIILS